MTQEERREFLLRYLINENPVHSDIEIPTNELEKKKLLRSLMNVRLPSQADSSFIDIQDEYLKIENLNRGIINLDDLEEIVENIYLWNGDITRLSCEAIVNAANSGMTGCYRPGHNCIDNCIHTYSGIQLRKFCYDIIKNQGYEESPGKAKITPAFNLPCKYIIHTIGPIVNGDLTYKDEETLKSCYISCLDIAKENNIGSIAFCCISTGVYMFPTKRAAEIAIYTVKNYLKQNELNLKVLFDVFNYEDEEIYLKLLKNS